MIVDKEQQLLIVEGNLWDMDGILHIAVTELLTSFCARFGNPERVIWRTQPVQKYALLPDILAKLAKSEDEARVIRSLQSGASYALPRSLATDSDMEGFLRAVLRPEFLSQETHTIFEVGKWRFIFRHHEDTAYYLEERNLFLFAVVQGIPEDALSMFFYPETINNRPTICVDRTDGALLSSHDVDVLRTIGDEWRERWGMIERRLAGPSGSADERMAQMIESEMLFWDFPGERYLRGRAQLAVQYLTIRPEHLWPAHVDPNEEECFKRAFQARLDEAKKKGRLPS